MADNGRSRLLALTEICFPLPVRKRLLIKYDFQQRLWPHRAKSKASMITLKTPETTRLVKDFRIKSTFNDLFLMY